jgi:hypothetical protein
VGTETCRLVAVVERKVAWRAPPPCFAKRTAGRRSSPSPVTVTAVPTGPAEGLIPVKERSFVLKLRGEEIGPPGFSTATVISPGWATRAAGMVVVSIPEPMKVVARVVPPK